MEPERRLDKRLNRSDQIVSITDVAEFMGEDALHLLWSQVIENAFRQ
jgi:hypothetical protein